jgi:hypothetical protein
MSPAEANEGGRPEKPKRDRSRRARGGAAEGAKSAAAEGVKSAPKGKRAARPAKGRPARKRSNPLGRLRTGEAIYLVAAILLFVLMFLDWWETGIGHETGGGLTAVSLFDHGQNAWQALEVIPLFLMLAIVVAVGSALLRLTGSEWKPAIPPGVGVTVLGGLAALLILIRIISPPDLVSSALAGVEFPVSLQLPIFLALAAALGIAYGGWRAMADEGTSFGGVAKRLESPQRPKRPKPEAKKPATATKPTTQKRATATKPTTKKSVATSKSATEKPATASEPGEKKPASPRRRSRKKPSA